ncbi:DHS-like NAD/FAD-binding domain [Phytophthora cactorum]|nr:DHS-like NAD/FAD-binding domain [Phytophthora cactorum]
MNQNLRVPIRHQHSSPVVHHPTSLNLLHHEHRTAQANDSSVPQVAQDAVLVRSENLEGKSAHVRGYDFNEGVNYEKLLQSYVTMGYQGTNLGEAIEEIKRMRPEFRKTVKTKIFLGYTSNLISSGLRETLRFLAQHKMVDVIVSSAGGIEEDFIKCLAPTYIGDFSLKGENLRRRGINRIGNLLVLMTTTARHSLVPSTMIHRFGKEINNEDSVYYWCYKNNIPVFCPSLTDGSIGDMIYFHSYRNEGLVVDIASDIRRMNDHTIRAPGKTGAIILGGGMVKHHILNANLMRNGADYAVFVNTGQEFDGSDAGARPDEAVSWGKLRLGSKPVKIYADATLVFPLIVAETFAKDFHNEKKEETAKSS